MTRLSLTLLLGCSALAAIGCKTSSNTEQPLREGGVPDSAAADGGLGGEDGDDDFRPPVITPPPRNPPPPAAGAAAQADAGSSGGAGAGSSAGAGGGESGASGAGASPAGGAAGSGGSPPDPEDDAGVSLPSCDEVNCHCDRLCDRGIALGCLDEAPLADCLSQCKTAAVGCEAEQLAALACRANAPDASYYCDEDLWQFDVRGCEAELAALQSCRTR